MGGMSEESVEGRILAHRQILGAIVAELAARGDGGGPLADLLGHRETLETGEEDPGAVPDPAIAVAAALSDEMRLVSQEADRRAQGIGS